MASVHWRMHKRLGQKLIGWEQKALKSWWLHWGMRRLGDPVTGFVPKIKMYCQFMVIIIGKIMIGGSKFGDKPIRPNNVKLKLWRKGMISIDPLQVAGWGLQLSPFFFHMFFHPNVNIHQPYLVLAAPLRRYQAQWKCSIIQDGVRKWVSLPTGCHDLVISLRICAEHNRKRIDCARRTRSNWHWPHANPWPGTGSSMFFHSGHKTWTQIMPSASEVTSNVPSNRFKSFQIHVNILYI